jgi:hypothetical protein
MDTPSDFFVILQAHLMVGRLEAFRLQFEEHFGALEISILLRSEDACLILICDPDQVAEIEANQQYLADQAFKIAFAWKLTLYCQEHLLWTISTKDISNEKTCPKLNESSFMQESNMSVQAPEKPKVSRQPKASKTAVQPDFPSKTELQSGLPLAIQVQNFAAKTGRSVAEIYAGVVANLPSDVAIAGLNRLIDFEIESEVEDFRRSRRSEFLGQAQNNGNGAVKQSRKPAEKSSKPTATKTRRAIAPSSSKPTRFKAFETGKRLATTISNFLTAQKYGDVKEQELLLTLSALSATAPEHPEVLESLPERIMARIIKAHKGSDRPAIISAVKRLLEKQAAPATAPEQAEPAA